MVWMLPSHIMIKSVVHVTNDGSTCVMVVGRDNLGVCILIVRVVTF